MNLNLFPRDANLEQAQDAWEKDRLAREEGGGQTLQDIFSYWILYFLMETWKGKMEHCTYHSGLKKIKNQQVFLVVELCNLKFPSVPDKDSAE